MRVLLKFNLIAVTALSRGTCDCASDLGRDTPSYSCCFCLCDRGWYWYWYWFVRVLSSLLGGGKKNVKNCWFIRLIYSGERSFLFSRARTNNHKTRQNPGSHAPVTEEISVIHFLPPSPSSPSLFSFVPAIQYLIYPLSSVSPILLHFTHAILWNELHIPNQSEDWKKPIGGVRRFG